ncbi:MAG: PIN domain nuclease [Nitrospirae bacterium]|nr:PIN domain nuclease [Nitrospirota bacterium]
MILADTSVLIDYFKGIQNTATNKLQFIFDAGIPFGINLFIYQELLQGVKTEKEFAELKAYLETQIFYELKNKKESFAKAADIYFRCRKKGYQVGSTIDCLIAQTAIENNLLLLHNDEDFEKISKVTRLRFY